MKTPRPGLKIALVALIAMFSGGQLRSEEIQWGAVFNNIFLSDSITLNPTNDAILLGHFAAGTNFSTSISFASLMAQFTLYQASAMSSPGTFTADTGDVTLPGAAGDQVYFWVFNNAVPANATQWAIVTNPLWLRPITGSGGAPGTLGVFNIGDPGNFIPPGALGTVVASGDLVMGNVVIPEPSTYFLGMVGGVALLGVMRLRRARAVTVS